MNTASSIRVLALACAALAWGGPAWAEVQASQGWARATAPGAKVAAAYLVFTNTGAQERHLLKIVTPVSDEVTLHRTSVDSQGVTRMWPMSVLVVPAGETLRLEPNGLHVMFNKLKAPLVAGQRIPLTMKFDGGEAEFTLLLEVRPLVPAADEHAGH